MTKPAKQQVRQSFERAAPRYDEVAAVQRRICDRLCQALPTPLPTGAILDAGCGTGYALPALTQHSPNPPLALDLSLAMLQRCPGTARRLAGDLEHLPLRDASLALYWSSLAWQWCEAPRVLAEAARTLMPGGHLAIATLGPATFHEVRHAFSGLDTYEHTLAFQGPEALAEAARQAGFVAVDVLTRPEIAHYPDFRTLLRAVKAMGANQLGAGRRRGLMSRQTFALAEARSESTREPQGLPLTYEVIYLHAQR